MKTERAVLGIGSAYVLGIAVLYVAGEGIAAAYLTFPGGLAAFQVVALVPPPLHEAVMSWTGNLAALLVGAALNVAGAYAIFRVLSKA
jgi:hypothetical protein